MHIVNRTLLVLIGLLLVAAGAIGIIEAAALALDRTPFLWDLSSWVETSQALTWSDARVRGMAVLLLVVGGLLIVAQLWPRRPGAYPVAGSGPRHFSYDRHGLERLAGQVASDNDEVADVNDVVLHRRRLRVGVIGYRSSDRQQLERTLRDELEQTIADLGLDRAPRPSVSVRLGTRRAR